MERQEAESRLESRLRSAVRDSSDLHSAYLLVHSDSRDLHWNLATGQTDGIEADPEQPYYAASIGKTFTSTIVAMLADDGQLSFDDPIS
ncbi:MAG: serine hydrolase, partial [Haloarculaceae archaeon]